MRDICMPEVAKSGAGLTVRKWLKAAGQAVSKGELLVLVEGEQGLVELESAQAGVLAEVVVPACKTAPTGAVIARMSDEQTQAVEPKTQATTVEVKMSGDVIPVLMPQAGNSMEEGTIVKWRVKEGDRITKGQIIFEVETDKATVEVEAMEEGRVAKIIVPEGGVGKVKEPVAFLSEGEVAGAPAGVAQPALALATGPSDEGDRREAAFSAMPADVIAVVMPQAGNSMEEGTIVKWRVKEGDRITKGQVIFEVETDKATMEVEATDSGRVAKIVVGEGGVQRVKEPVAYLSEGDVSVSPQPQKEQPQKAQKAQEVAIAASASSTVAVASAAAGTLKVSPAARKMAKEKGLDLASIGTGSGPGGRILSTDLTRAKAAGTSNAASAATTSAGAGGVGRRKITKMRKAIAANLTTSKQTVPHFYLRATVNADAMMAFYKGEKAKYPCSVNDVVTMACARVIMEFPAFRSKIDGDEIVEYPQANIGVAVGVDDGLTVPVLINAQAMTLQQIGQNTKRIAENARAGKLEGYGQGNFTISNLGMFGVEEFAAIVNPPEPAILAVGAAREAVVVKDGAMKAGRVMTMTLSCDHRLIDGLLAAKFMARLKELLENPSQLA